MADIHLSVDEREHGSWSVLDVRGEVDLYTAPTLKDRLNRLIEGGRHRIVLNLEEVGFMDSTGLGVLIGALKRCREQEGSLALAGPQDPVQKVLGITGLDRVFPIHGSVEDAAGG